MNKAFKNLKKIEIYDITVSGIYLVSYRAVEVDGNYSVIVECTDINYTGTDFAFKDIVCIHDNSDPKGDLQNWSLYGATTDIDKYTILEIPRDEYPEYFI